MRAPAAPPVEPAPAAASATVQRKLIAPYMNRSTFSEDSDMVKQHERLGPRGRHAHAQRVPRGGRQRRHAL